MIKISKGRAALLAAAALATGAIASSLSAHGNVTPQAVDTSALPDLVGGNDTWVTVNPYRGNEKALEIGQSAYGQNCARCHGLDAISGGIAPDLRYLETGDSGDEWFVQRFQHGSSRDGKVYMPPFGEVLGQKAGWAIRTWIESKHTEE
ncbi:MULTISPECIES: cytochrome c-550 PedF [Novosphingobium]|jgi:cytochrome c-550 PedF|uniref:Putative cytochrome c550 n=1 Tax=Novosphingobium subterraneum TaxID=48936 RepID=A0A0B9A6T1_9SPHN|nr:MULTISPECIES: cytochrome c-550 PedF [Novosphingobium]KHS44985.1 putative cytochrome c550 [Novosphingobium subterraneum]QOV95666.1 cytochrome c-550 PedF [Novosphingobium sp. ES2-1]